MGITATATGPTVTMAMGVAGAIRLQEHPILSRVETVSAAEVSDSLEGNFTGCRNQLTAERTRQPRQAAGFLVKEVCAMPDEKITAIEARQATMRPRAMVLVLFASLFLCLMAGLGLARGWFSLPSPPQ
jgi:hypothetical protein